jgi:uncharacterized membrane protein YqiK
MEHKPSPLLDLSPSERAARRRAEKALNEFNSSIAALRTEADRSRSIFGLGRRIIVPPDEIHVVVGDGRHVFLLANERKVFGQTADRPSRYWLNPLTQVIKLKTISFTVGLRGINDEGIEALDSSKVSFRLWAHAVAKLNPDKAEIAAQRVGLDTTGLVNTITEVGTAELVAAAATMSLQDIIASRQRLAEIAFPKVNQILSELGYDLALLTITQLEGMAYHKLVEQAESRISKETSIATNLEQVAEIQDDQARARVEAEIQAATEKKLAYERLEAQREVETATLGQQEALAIRRHQVEVKGIERAKSEAEAAHLTDLARVQLGEQLGKAEVEREAQLARLKAEREAELKLIQQKKAAEVRLVETQAEAERLAVEQVRHIERAAERTEAEARRLREEELAAAQRAKEVALVEANKLGEALTVEAQAQARALQLKVEAETRMELVQAEAEANATEKRAQAAKVRAEATRAEAAASGLAEAEVESARVSVSEKQVAVNRTEGLALAEVARAQAQAEAERMQRLKEVEINAQRQLKELYEQAPVLVDLERMRMQFAHHERVTSLQLEAYVQAFQALAPGVRIHIYGNGGQASQLLTDVLSLSQGVNLLAEEVPVVGRFLEGVNGGSSASRQTAPEASSPNGSSAWFSRMGDLLPYVRQMLASTNPRILSSLKVADLVERLGPVLEGKEDLTTALTHIKNDANFRVIGELPVAPLLKAVGIRLDEKQADITGAMDDPAEDKDSLELA